MYTKTHQEYLEWNILGHAPAYHPRRFNPSKGSDRTICTYTCDEGTPYPIVYTTYTLMHYSYVNLQPPAFRRSSRGVYGRLSGTLVSPTSCCRKKAYLLVKFIQSCLFRKERTIECLHYLLAPLYIRTHQKYLNRTS